MRDVLSTPINLASQPFRRERAQNAALTLVCIGLACSLIFLVLLIVNERAKAADLRRGINAARAELDRLGREQASFSRVLGRPENADVFSRNVFLNQLIARRAISWTLVFRDLENILPANVRLIGIRLPQLASEDSAGVDRVQLDMTVGTDRPEAVVELLNRLQHSPLFDAAQVLGQQPPTQNDPTFKYRISVAYAQKL
jgi:hypothetical protein